MPTAKRVDERDWTINEKNKTSAEVYRITENGNEFIKDIPVKNNTIHLSIPSRTGYVIICK